MPSPPLASDSATDVGQIRRAKRRLDRRQKAYDAALKAMMRSPDGGRVLWELLGRAGTTRTVVSQGYDPHRVMFEAGAQDFGFTLLADMHRVDLEGYLALEETMRAEQQREIKEEQAARTPSVKEGTERDE